MRHYRKQCKIVFKFKRICGDVIILTIADRSGRHHHLMIGKGGTSEANVMHPTQTICITFTNEAANLFPIKRFIQIDRSTTTTT